MKVQFKPLIIALLLVLLAVVSATFVADYAMDTENHQGTILSLDEKVSTAKTLTASSTLASVGVTALPGDFATPIADKLAECSQYFLVVLCVLFTEKYLLTLLGAAVFRFLVPIACALCIVGIFKKSQTFFRVAAKLVIFGLLLFLVIPISVKTSDLIYETYQATIDETIEKAEELTDVTDAMKDTDENQNLIDSILSYFGETTNGLVNKAGDILNRFTEAIAVMIVTTCLIPILVLLFFLWLAKTMWGVTIPMPSVFGKTHFNFLNHKEKDTIMISEPAVKDETQGKND